MKGVMIQSKTTTKGHRPLIPLLAILFITLTLIMGLFWHIWSNYKDVKFIQEQGLQVQRLAGTILHLDEVLVQSALMCVATGSQKWEERYQRIELQLDAAIKKARRLAPDAFSIHVADQTGAAHVKLAAMEEQAFDLVRKGQKDAASTLLFSDVYEEQTRIYAQGMEKITAEMQVSVDRVLNKHRKDMFLTIMAVAIALPCLTIAWGYILRLMRKHITKAEEQLHKLSHAIENISATVVITDTEGKIEYVNPKFCQLTGYSVSDAIGKNPRILQSGKTPPEDYKELWKTIKSGKEWRGEFCNRKNSGELYWESALISPVKDDKGVIINFIAIKDDITEKKKMEEALLQSEKLKSLGTITAGISHDFNNILAIISGNVQLLEESCKDDAGLTKALHTIKRAADDGAQISGRMLKFTKRDIDSSGFVPFDINELINQAIDFTIPRWKNEAQVKGINYHMDTEGMMSVPSILCNPAELREVFVNIINNALDAMPDDGRITFRTWSEDSTVFMNISDTGGGITEEVKKNIFDPFFSTKGVKGTGLGLSTAYGIISGHGGKIEVESEGGKGSIFTLQFPAAAEADRPEELPETEQEIKRDSLSVLVIDDEEDICNILDNFLSKKGHLVRTVGNGKEAIILAKAINYDLVLCDIAMPDVNGHEVVRALNKLEKRPKIGIITGWGEKLKPIDDEEFKVDFIIKKPFDLSELSKHINELGI
ncbi:MAG: Sensor histidine kinase RcsC [Candidatus Scalindua arabica]|uniref:histidine kinase n=1 Tax=Candidatus Scalindua arabica TaxID=1127984 RepID=A0A941W3R8_9BACT|nr:Sensor histidine kinase RcsC [Candidatus Scalindua arabica]